MPRFGILWGAALHKINLQFLKGPETLKDSGERDLKDGGLDYPRIGWS